MVKNDGFWGWTAKCQKTYENRLKNHIGIILRKKMIEKAPNIQEMACWRRSPPFLQDIGQNNNFFMISFAFFNVLERLKTWIFLSQRMLLKSFSDRARKERDESVVLSYCTLWLHSPKTSLPSRFWSRKWKFFCLIKYPGKHTDSKDTLCGLPSFSYRLGMRATNTLHHWSRTNLPLIDLQHWLSWNCSCG